MGMLAKIRRIRFREQLSVREITRRTGLSRNTIRQWLRQDGGTEPRYPARVMPSKLDAYKEQLLMRPLNSAYGCCLLRSFSRDNTGIQRPDHDH